MGQVWEVMWALTAFKRIPFPVIGYWAKASLSHFLFAREVTLIHLASRNTRVATLQERLSNRLSINRQNQHFTLERHHYCIYEKFLHRFISFPRSEWMICDICGINFEHITDSSVVQSSWGNGYSNRSDRPFYSIYCAYGDLLLCVQVSYSSLYPHQKTTKCRRHQFHIRTYQKLDC